MPKSTVLKFKLHNGQLEVARDKHRFKVVCAGRRWGKSVLARSIVLKWALDNQGLFWIVAPTYQQAKDIHWLQGFKAELPDNLVAKWNDSELSVELVNGSKIQLKSSENPDRLRGVKLRGLVVDEIASMRNWQSIWLEALRPTLTDYQSPALFISTPAGFNHFYDLFMLGQQLEGKEGDSPYRSWRFTSYDNKIIPASEIDQARTELTEDAFAQEYLADFRKYTGLVYKDFAPETHIVKPFEIPSHWAIYRGIDFGSTNPTAVVWVAIDPDGNWFVFDEHYKAGETIDYHAGLINSKSANINVVHTFGDPSGAQWINEFSSRGVYISQAKKDTGTSQNNWVRYGIEMLQEKIKVVPGHFVEQKPTDTSVGSPRLFVFATCENLINEFQQYRWKKKPSQMADLNEPDVPEKSNDHALDALRYVVVSYDEGLSTHGDYSLFQQRYQEKDSDLGF